MATSATCWKISALMAAAVLIGSSLGRAGEPRQRPRATNPDDSKSATAEPDQAPAEGQEKATAEPTGKVIKSDAEWQKILTRSQYYVTRLKGTEPAWSGRYARGHWKGTFTCVCCGADLFRSTHKFASGTGWPSFWRPIRQGVLTTAPDYNGPEFRVEVNCARCDAHLGHVFRDGPPPTGLRFCINSTSLRLKPFEKADAKKTKAKEDAKAAESPPDKPKSDTPNEAAETARP